MKNKTVASKFRLIILGSISISVILSSIVISAVLLNQFSRNTREKDMLHIKGIAGTVKGLLDQAFTLNHMLAINPMIIQTVLSADPDWEKRVRQYNMDKSMGLQISDNSGFPLLVEMQKTYQFAELFFVQDSNGDQTARSFGPLGHRGRRWWFQKMIDNDNRPFISKSYYSMTGNKPVSSVFHEIQSDGRFIGIMGMDINFEKLQALVQDYLKTGDLSAIVIDNTGVIIAHPENQKLQEIYNLSDLTRNVLVKDTKGDVIQNNTGHHNTRAVKLNWSDKVPGIVSQVLHGKNGYVDDVILEGINTTLYYEPVPITVHQGDTGNYGVIMIRDHTSLRSTKFWLCVFVFLFSGLSTLILYLLFQSQFRRIILVPLHKLNMSMKRIDPSDPKDVKLDTHDEFMVLAETYNHMRSKLESTGRDLSLLNEELEKRVADRTKEMEEVNTRLQKDMSARESMEKAFRESEDRYRKTFEAAPDSIMILRMRDGEYLDVNDAFCRLTGFSKEEMIGKRTSEIDMIGDAADRNIFEKTLQMEKEVGSLEIKCKKKDGTLLSVLVSARSLMYGDDECLIMILTDITERKQIEAALRESEEKYRLLTENANDAIFIVQDGKILFPNPKANELGRYLGGRPESSSYFDYIHPKDRAKIIERHLKRISGETLPEICTFRLVADSGKELWAELNDVFITWGGRPAILSFLRDITNQKKLEIQMEKAERMEAIGTLAGGIAHNFNNLLMGIQGNLSLILMDEESSKKDYDELKSIERCIENGANLTKQLLGFARGGKYIVKPIDPNEIVQETSKMFGQSKKEIKIHGSFEKKIWTIEADKGQIELVLLNIYVNAAQAMETGGDIYLSTENVLLSSDAVFPGISTGRYIKISIADTGPGIDEKIADKIFEPFFTTKEVGKGTGLGLASAFGIVKNHGGFIDVKSVKGEGARFDIYLPATDEADLPEEIPMEEIATGTETILVIDDEDVIVDVCQSILKKLGYQVIAARGGRAGIELYNREKDRIALVILDIIMPDMEGGRVFDAIREINPEAKVLLASGCSINDQASLILKKGGSGFIQKPFKIKQLSSLIRDIIGRT